MKNVSSHTLLNLIKGPSLDYGPYEYSLNGTIVILNVVCLVIGYFLFKKGKKLLTKNNKE